MDARLEATEGGTAGAGDPFAIQLSVVPTAAVTVALSGGGLTFYTSDDATGSAYSVVSSVTIGADTTTSRPLWVTGRHDRDTESENVDITATASGDEKYAGLSTTIYAQNKDDDFSVTVSPDEVTENNALTADVATLITVTVRPPPAGTVTPIPLGTSGAGYEFRPYVKDAPYDPTATAITAIAGPGSTATDDYELTVAKDMKSASAKVWLLVADDATNPTTPETIQIGTTPTGDAARIVPDMITVTDADPEVTLTLTAADGTSSIAEGAQNVTMTLKATASSVMPGIFEIDLASATLNVAGNGASDETVTVTGSGLLVIDEGDREGTVTITVSAADGAASGTDVNTADDTVYIGFADPPAEAAVSTVTVSVDGTDTTVTVGSAKLTVVDNDDT